MRNEPCAPHDVSLNKRVKRGGLCDARGVFVRPGEGAKE